MFNNVFGFIEPKEISVDGKDLVISKFPAVPGIEIASQFPAGFNTLTVDGLSPLIAKIIAYVAVRANNDNYIRLNSIDQINNHLITPYPLETLTKIIAEIMEYNFSFLEPGSLLNLLKGAFQMFQQSISKMSTVSSELLSLTEKQH
jgi:hypothetical protein